MFLTRTYSKKTGWGIRVLYYMKAKREGMLQRIVSEYVLLLSFFLK